MDAVAQANGIDETQLNNGHCKRLKKSTWKVERNSNLLLGMEERAQLNENGLQGEASWLHEFRGKSSATRT